jgi:hypothetical protein
VTRRAVTLVPARGARVIARPAPHQGTRRPSLQQTAQ